MQKSPAPAGQILKKDTGEEHNGPKYWFIVGKAMFVVTKTLIKAANVAQELTKFYKEPRKGHWEALGYLAGYLKREHDNITLTFRPPEEMRLIGLVNAKFATDWTDQKSMTGGIYMLGGSIVSWSSKSQTWTAISTTEPEYYTISQGAEKLLFVCSMLQELGVLEDPGYLLGDNNRSIQLVRNCQSSLHTKHIKPQHHFVRDLWEDKILDISYVGTNDNESNICTKNVATKFHERHIANIRSGKLNFIYKYYQLIQVA